MMSACRFRNHPYRSFRLKMANQSYHTLLPPLCVWRCGGGVAGVYDGTIVRARKNSDTENTVRTEETHG